MKILKLKDSDFDVYGDWLQASASDIFVIGGYTHVENQGETNECEFIGPDSEGKPMVMVGRSIVVGFELGKYYSHTGGGFLHILCKANTTMWGDDVLIAESSGHGSDLQPVGSDSDAAQNWEETTKEEWLSNFS